LHWSFSWDIISFYKKKEKGKARRRQSAHAYEKIKRKTMRKTYNGKK
jgi:hypothetical protein